MQCLLLEVEEHLGKTRLFLGQGKHGFVHDLQAQRGLHAFAPRIGHMETDTGFRARFVLRGVCRGLNLELIGRLDEDQAVIAHGTGVPPEQVGAEVQRSRHFGCGCHGKFSLAVFQVQVAGQHRLAFFDDVHVYGASLLRREDSQLNGIAGSIDRAFHPQKNLVFPATDGQRNRGRYPVPFLVGGLNFQRWRAGGGVEADYGHSAVIGGH